jgi:NADH-quinone oxidoreductase subunit J
MANKLQAVFFYLFAAITILPGICVLTTRDIVRAAFWLLLSLSGFAGLYVLLGADFLAVTQVIVYLGGILILILFGVMLTNTDPGLLKKVPRLNIVVPGVASSLTIIAAALAGLTRAGFVTEKQDSQNFQPTVDEIGARLMTDYLLAFELASVLLLAALVGAAYIARRGAGRAVEELES